jgi:1-phosphatidylinositol-4-phosphate 5-kinase
VDNQTPKSTPTDLSLCPSHTPTRNSPELGPYRYKSNSADYTGQYKGNKRHGYGELTWPDGSIYEGQFHEDKIQGLGRYISVKYQVYTGNWRNNERNGYGKLTYSDKSSYKGFWVDNCKHGFGKDTDWLGNAYEGQFNRGLREGLKGVYTQTKGEFYSGGWKNDMMNGHGNTV